MPRFSLITCLCAIGATASFATPGFSAELPATADRVLRATSAAAGGPAPGALAEGLRARASVPTDTPRADGWSVNDVLFQESAGDFRISPDGEWVVWTRSGMDHGEGRRATNLWLTRLADGESWPLTRGDGRHRSPRWSPDGTRIAFLSSREVPDADEDGGGGSQIWLFRLPGGEPRPVTKGLRGIRGFEWKGTGDTLVVVAEEERTRYERELEEADDDAVVVEDTLTTPYVRLWAVPVETGRAERLTTNRDWIRSAAVSPDGRRAVVVAGDDLSYRFDALNPPHTYLVELATGERTELFAGREVLPYGIEWAPDGSGFYLAYPYSSHPIYRNATETRMGFYGLGERRFRRIDLDWDWGLGRGFEAVPGGFVAWLADGVRYRPALYRRDGAGWEREMLEGEHVPQIFDWSVSDDGRSLAYTTSASDRPPQPYAARLDGAQIREPVQLEELNPSFAEKPMPRTEVVRWTGARGDTVEGVLYYPLEWERDRRYPLIVSIHGGPTGVDMDRWDQGWSDPTMLFSQRQAFVFKPNYHGSGNYGLEWAESIGGGRYYELEVPDIEAGIDRLIERGLVHADSIASVGWSNGAILTTALTIENPERYKAAVPGAGDVEWISDWGNVDFGASFDNYYFGTSPLEDPEFYIEKSPFFELDRVRAPTLIFFGTEDRNVPPSQGWSHFRALQQLDNTEVRFVLFPGEPHGLRELRHQRRKVEEELEWLDRHLWGHPPQPERLAVDEDSPLARALRLERAARHEGRWGERVNGVLAPETVPVADLGVGRFEVTRAQWAEYDDEYGYAPGTGDLPVGGVTFEEARRYVDWLREATGRGYRLPESRELEALVGAAPAGNALDRWAGYAPNPEDGAKLQALVERLSGAAPLLEPVGRFGGLAVDAPSAGAPAGIGARDRAGVGDAGRIYDLGGNVAEWAVGDDGSGVLIGGSADRAFGASGEAAPEYRGLRIVTGETRVAGTER